MTAHLHKLFVPKVLKSQQHRLRRSAEQGPDQQPEHDDSKYKIHFVISALLNQVHSSPAVLYKYRVTTPKTLQCKLNDLYLARIMCAASAVTLWCWCGQRNKQTPEAVGSEHESDSLGVMQQGTSTQQLLFKVLKTKKLLSLIKSGTSAK